MPKTRNTEMPEREERALMASSEAGEWESVGDLDARRQFWQLAAGSHLKAKRQRISIAIPEHDLRRLKARAVEEGIPYQTLINSLIHKYVEGNL